MSKNSQNLKRTALNIVEYSLFLDHNLVLDNVSFEVNFGEITTLIGPNGAGKTSLLKAIAGDFPDADSQACLEFCEELHPLRNSLAERAKNIGVLPQQSELQFPFTVKEVVALGRIPHNVSSSLNEKIISEVMARLKIDSLKEVQYTTLSGGEKQRVQLARVFSQVWDDDFFSAVSRNNLEKNRPHKLLLLDEPTASLDLNYQECFLDTIKFLSGCGVAIIIVSHDINLSLKYSGNFVAMKKGSVIKQGEEDIMTSELFKVLFEVDASVISHPNGGRLVAF